MSTPYPLDREGGARAPRERSFLGRAIGIFVSPAATVDHIRERPNWVPPLLVLIGVYVVLALVIPESLFREMIGAQIAAQGQELAPQEMDAAVTVGRILAILAMIVLPIVGTLVTAGMLFMIFVLLAGAEARFAQLFSATVYANLIPALGALVTTPVMIAQRDLEAQLSFALLVPGLEEGLAYALLNSITIFGLWTAVVLGIAAARISQSVRTGTAVGIVLGLYGVWVVVFALFSTLAGAA